MKKRVGSNDLSMDLFCVGKKSISPQTCACVMGHKDAMRSVTKIGVKKISWGVIFCLSGVPGGRGLLRVALGRPWTHGVTPWSIY